MSNDDAADASNAVDEDVADFPASTGYKELMELVADGIECHDADARDNAPLNGLLVEAYDVISENTENEVGGDVG